MADLARTICLPGIRRIASRRDRYGPRIAGVGADLHDTPETASRVRGRIETVLDWAKARGYREGENSARWRGHIENLLPPRCKLRAVVHHAALPYREIAAFLLELRQYDDVGSRALEFAILTAGRSGEVRKATWYEFGDLAEKLWIVPAARMKAGREHRVPLSAQRCGARDPCEAGGGAVQRLCVPRQPRRRPHQR